MCYGYGLREKEMNVSSPQFISLFLQGNLMREAESIKAGWEQARLIATAMSKDAKKIKFSWERKRSKVKIDESVFDKFTFEEGRPLLPSDLARLKIGSR